MKWKQGDRCLGAGNLRHVLAGLDFGKAVSLPKRVVGPLTRYRFCFFVPAHLLLCPKGAEALIIPWLIQVWSI